MTGRKQGRPRKPTELKILEGNPGKRPLPTNEWKPKPMAPKCPNWLHKYAKKEWKAIVPKLEEYGLLTEVDATALAAYCQAYARWREAEEFMSRHNTVFKTTSGYIQQVPQVVIAQKYMALMSTYLSKFGLSPADRVGMVNPKGPEKQSKLASLLSG